MSLPPLLKLAIITYLVFLALADRPHLTHRDSEAYNSLAFGLVPNQTYHTVNFSSPLFLINTLHPDAVSKESHIFLSPAVSGQGQSPLIFDSRDFSLVYADPSWSGGSDARVQMFNNTPYLTFWSGTHYKGWSGGGDVLVDNTYKKQYNLTTANVPNGADAHEFQLTDNGAALINNFHTIRHNLSPVGGNTNGTIQTNVFQKIDISTGAELFSWSALDHFSLTESFVAYDSNDNREEGWDWFHLNSLQEIPASLLFPDEDDSKSPPYYLISSRHLCAVILISGATGAKVWQLGGKKNDFSSYYTDSSSTSPSLTINNNLAPSPEFAFQHDVRLHFSLSPSYSQGGKNNLRAITTTAHLTLFDNHNMIADNSWTATPGCTTNCSRGLRLDLDLETLAVTSTTELAHPAGVRAYAEGGYQELSSPSSGKNNALVAFGKVPSLVEFSGDEEAVTVAMDVQTGPWKSGASSLYRAFKGEWEVDLDGLQWGPQVVVEGFGAQGGGKGGEVFVSWNGATGVEGWRLYGGNSSENMKEIQSVRRSGFETTISVEGKMSRMVRVDALDGDGNVLRSSEVVDIGVH